MSRPVLATRYRSLCDREHVVYVVEARQGDVVRDGVVLLLVENEDLRLRAQDDLSPLREPCLKTNEGIESGHASGGDV